MSLQETPSGERVHIGFFGLRNAGKSSLVNAVTGQSLSVVSDVKGTTTDPVKKAMELLPIGPVLILDTPGLDDEGELGLLRVQKTKETLAHTDICVLVTDATSDLSTAETALIKECQARELPYLIVYNKADLIPDRNQTPDNALYVSAKTGEGVFELKERLGKLAQQTKKEKKILADLVEAGDTVVLVTPIDESAPKGRLILPQQQTLRELLDLHCTAICCQVPELENTIKALNKQVKLVVTDSQACEKVAAVTPDKIPLTSFSILFARYKGDLPALIRGAAKLSALRDGDLVLISEGCTHHRQCNDIGTVKMPGWIRAFSGVQPEFSFTSGGEFPDDLFRYSLIVHCGGCMLNEAEMRHRIRTAGAAGVPIVNYGIAIAHMHGILERSLRPFEQVHALL